MTIPKLSFFLMIYLLITTNIFITGIEAQETQKDSAPVQEFVKKAQEFVKLNQFEEAIEIYERIMKAAPEDLESRAQLATLYSATDQHEKASEIYRSTGCVKFLHKFQFGSTCDISREMVSFPNIIIVF